MSYVTNIIVHCSICDSGQAALLEPFCKGSRPQSLKIITDGDAGRWWGGDKNPEVELYAAAFNYLPWPDFVARIEGLAWQYPEDVQVLVQDQNDSRLSVFELRNGKLECVLDRSGR